MAIHQKPCLDRFPEQKQSLCFPGSFGSPPGPQNIVARIYPPARTPPPHRFFTSVKSFLFPRLSRHTDKGTSRERAAVRPAAGAEVLHASMDAPPRAGMPPPSPPPPPIGLMALRGVPGAWGPRRGCCSGHSWSPLRGAGAALVVPCSCLRFEGHGAALAATRTSPLDGSALPSPLRRRGAALATDAHVMLAVSASRARSCPCTS